MKRPLRWLLIDLPALWFVATLCLIAWWAIPEAGKATLSFPPVGRDWPSDLEGLGSLQLAGRIVERDGQPAAGLLVACEQGGFIQRAVTKSDGSFVLTGLRAGAALLDILVRGRLPQSFPVKLPCDPVELHLGSEARELSAATAAARSPLEVTVRLPVSDIEGPAALRLVLIPELPADAAPGPPHEAVLDASGRARFEALPHGVWRAWLLAKGRSLAGRSNLLADLSGAAPRLEHGGPSAETLLAHHGRIQGLLVEDSGAALSEAEVILQAEDGTPWAATRSAEDGSFCFSHVPPGPWRVLWQRGRSGGDRGITVPAGEVLELREGL